MGKESGKSQRGVMGLSHVSFSQCLCVSVFLSACPISSSPEVAAQVLGVCNLFPKPTDISSLPPRLISVFLYQLNSAWKKNLLMALL